MAQVKSESSRAESEQKKWLIFADGQGIGQELGRLLQSKGEGCIFVFPGKDYQKLSEQEFRIDPASKADFQQLLKAVGVNQTSLHGVVHLWSLDAVEAGTLTSTNLEEASKQGCGSTLHLVQSLCEFSALPSLWLITQGAVPAGEKPNVPGVAQSALWGMGKVIALEHPELNCVRVDLDPDDQRNQAQALFEEIWLETTEDEVAFRDQSRHVARLMPISRTKESLVQDRLEVPHSQSFQLGTSDRGILENLELQPTTRCQPSGDEVEIQVYATGLNFRDVLSALGLYPGDPGLFGCECAGKVVAIGEDVEGFEIGESVVAIAPGGFSKYVTVKADLVVSKPESLSFEEAATIPVAFLTAYYTLHHLANISPGDRVLIHAATGGVGQAAVQLAQQAGAEVLGTASPAKWEFLKSLGVKHIMNSRTLDFAEEVMAITEGQGVDIVLNSLSGEFIPKSLSVLSAEGRFLEIGKRGVWDASQVSQVKPRASYFLVDLMQVSQHQPALVQPMLRQLMQQFQEGKLKPLAQKVFPIQEAVSAFRYMQQAKHIGKIVVSQGLEIVNLAEQKPITFERNSTYLITGGTGGLGLLMARWMVEKGARHLILVGRSGASSAISSQLRELEQAGAEVVVAKADVSEVEQVAQVFKEIMQSQPPLRGIIHAAGILDDGLLMQLSWERFYRVMAAKVEGAWNLHKLTQDLPLDFFVCFSSITSLLGNMGQGNYAAANAFLDALAYHRRAIGLPGLTINWGPWADVGMAANMGHSEQSRLADRGLGRISPEQGLQVLAELLTQVATQVGAVPLNWQKFLQQFSAGSYPALFSDFAAKIQQQEKLQQTLVQPTNLLEQLEKATPDERRKLLVKYLQQQVKKLLGFDASSPLEPNQLLSELGLDSLVSIQLRNRIRTQLKVDLPIDQFLESTIVQLGNSLLEKLALANIILSEAPSTDLGEDMEEITL